MITSTRQPERKQITTSDHSFEKSITSNHLLANTIVESSYQELIECFFIFSFIFNFNQPELTPEAEYLLVSKMRVNKRNILL